MTVDFDAYQRLTLGAIGVILVGAFNKPLLTANRPNWVALQCVDVEATAVQYYAQ